MRLFVDFWKCFNLPPDLEDSAHANFMAWERLRLYFNGIVLMVVAISGGIAALPIFDQSIGAPNYLGRLEHLFHNGLGLLVALNLLYCLGYSLEGYFLWPKRKRGSARLELFILGTVISCLPSGLLAAGLMSTNP